MGNEEGFSDYTVLYASTVDVQKMLTDKHVAN